MFNMKKKENIYLCKIHIHTMAEFKDVLVLLQLTPDVFSVHLTSSPCDPSYDNNHYCIYKPGSVPQPLNLYFKLSGNLYFPMLN